MGIDLKSQGRIKSRYSRTATTSNNYHQLLIKLYKFLARRTDAPFNEVVHKRLNQSRITRYPISISKLIKHADSDDKKGKILVVVGKVLNDERLLQVPKLRVCALQFTETARAKIIKAGGECLSFNELVKIAPEGKGTILLRGRRSREALKHFGPGVGTPGAHTKPYVLNANHKSKERQYGHRSK
mgnify:CR=1 FL=1